MSMTDEDQAVIHRIMEGAIDDFEVLLRKYSPKVFAMVGHKVPAEDVGAVAQDVFMSAYRSVGTYEAQQPFEHWLARIARRRCCDYWRERERQNKITATSMDAAETPWLARALYDLAHHSSHQENMRQATAERVQQALEGLDAEDRSLIEGIYFEDVPLKEMASTLGWSLVKTKVRAHRARNKLRIIMETIFGTEVKQ